VGTRAHRPLTGRRAASRGARLTQRPLGEQERLYPALGNRYHGEAGYAAVGPRGGGIQLGHLLGRRQRPGTQAPVTRTFDPTVRGASPVGVPTPRCPPARGGAPGRPRRRRPRRDGGLSPQSPRSQPSHLPLLAISCGPAVPAARGAQARGRSRRGWRAGRSGPWTHPQVTFRHSSDEPDPCKCVKPQHQRQPRWPASEQHGRR